MTPNDYVGAIMELCQKKRGITTSICKRPKKPQRKPKPKAWEVSASNCSEASFKRNFSSAFGAIMELCQKKRGIYKDMVYIDNNRMDIIYELPLGEIVFILTLNALLYHIHM